MEIVGVELLEVVGLGGRLEEHTAKGGVVLHGAAGVHQKQHLHRVFPGLFPADAEGARLVAGIVDGALHVHLPLAGVALDAELAQKAEGRLELAHVQGVVLAEVPVFPISGHHHGGAVAALSPHPDPVGVPAAVAEGGAALGAHPVIAAVVLLGLLPEAFLQAPEKLLQRLVGKARGFQLLQGPAQVLCGVVQPVHQLLRQVALPGNVLEKLQKHLVEAVKIRLALDEHRPAELVKPCQGGAVEPLFHAGEEGHPLVEGDLQPPGAQEVKK